MHILITDSGVGGLSVVAYAERFVREHGVSEPVRLTFANAAPENDYGYNSMPTKKEKIDTFDRFLRNVSARYSPDSIYVACNSLSVLLEETPFHQQGRVPIQGIVETGVTLLLQALEENPDSVAMIFATQTTVDAGAYARILGERGIDPSRIVSQACPGLADTISEDREGSRTRAEIQGWVRKAIEKMQRPGAPVVAALACTHYGYRREHFVAAFDDAGLEARVLNPNESAVDDIFETDRPGDVRVAEVKFVTRYAIPPATIAALTYFLGDVSPRTVEAMRQFEHVPTLF